MDQDRFAFIDIEAGTLSSSQQTLIDASTFINTDSFQVPIVEKNKGKGPFDLLQVLKKPCNGGSVANLKDMDIPEIAAAEGIIFDPPKWHRHGGYDAKINDKRLSLNVEENKEKVAVQEEGRGDARSKCAAPKAPTDLLKLFRPLSPEVATELGNMDVLEIAATKGIRFDPPKWHRPGGYDAKPRDESGSK